MRTERDIFYNDVNVRYSNLITIQFNTNIIDKTPGIKTASISDIKSEVLRKYFSTIIQRYGCVNLEKVFPKTYWGDTVRTHRRTHQPVKVPDLSQIYRINFSQLVPIDSIIVELKKLPFISFAEPPSECHFVSAPSDPLYTGNGKWAFDRIFAERAWDITRGSHDIVISINDSFDDTSSTQIHEDLISKVVNATLPYYGGHGTSVAGIAGATTNNDTGIASLGWNLNLMLNTWGHEGVYEAVSNGADVINFSWIPGNSATRTAIDYALSQGVVCVGGAGDESINDLIIPFIAEPAGYYFSSTKQVIAVSATRWDGQNETFVDGWNYCPGTDYFVGPTQSFIDCAAPGMSINIITGHNTYSSQGAGTSDAAPFVSALAGLILSINDALTPSQIYTIITNTTDKVGQYSYLPVGSTGKTWNKYLGYGRINAYKALKYTIENYGGTFTQNVIIPKGDTWNLQPGVTLKFADNCSLIVYGVLHAQGTASNKITFDRIGSAGYWGYLQFDSSYVAQGGNINCLNNVIVKHSAGIKILRSDCVQIVNSVIDSCVQGIYIENSSPWIVGSDIRPNNNAIYGSGLASPYINNNVLHKESEYPGYHTCLGIYLTEYMLPTASQNTISGFDIGMYYGGTSVAAWFLDDQGYYPYPNNQIINNNTGLMVGWGAICCAGGQYDYGFNSIHSNTRDLYCYLNSNIWVDGNYWGGGNPTSPYCDNTSHIYFTSTLSTDPWNLNNYQKPQESTHSVPELLKKSKNTDVYAKLAKGFALEKSGKIDEAIMHYKDMAGENIAANAALTQIALLSKKFNKGDIKPFLIELLERKNENESDIIGLLANIALDNGNYDEAMNLYNDIISRFPDSYLALNARLNKVFAALHVEKNVKKAAQILSELEQISITDVGLNQRMQIAREFILKPSSDEYSANKKALHATNAGNVITEYALSNNYPNPFNPNTTISFQLPQDVYVKLMIFDALGREVKTLINEKKRKGIYTVKFDGANLPSGVYFYALQAEGFYLTKKMLLVK